MFLLLKVHQVLTGTQISFELKVPVVCDTSPHHFLSCKMTFFFSFSVIFFKEKKKKKSCMQFVLFLVKLWDSSSNFFLAAISFMPSTY